MFPFLFSFSSLQTAHLYYLHQDKFLSFLHRLSLTEPQGLSRGFIYKKSIFISGKVFIQILSKSLDITIN